MPFEKPQLYQNMDEMHIARCIALAELGAGTVSPNPMVGAVVLDAHGRKVGEGYHQQAGKHHAEVIALQQAGDRARGGTLYVNLEPCNHHGKTPPCTQTIIEAGIQRVVCGTLDPNPLVSGTGRDCLQNARVSVRYGFLEAECKKLNAVFFHYITQQTPWVTVKLALTMDGKVANRHGESQWLTGAFSRQYAHHLRQNHDAVMTTAETVIADNPRLNVRDIPHARKQPIRIILDRRLRLDPERYRIFSEGESPVWVVTAPAMQDERNARKLKSRGIKMIEADTLGEGFDLKSVLACLGEHEITSLLVEAGGRLSSALMRENRADRLYLFYAPKVLWDAMAKPAFSDMFQLNLPDAPQMEILDTRRLSPDWVVEARPCFKNGHN